MNRDHIYATAATFFVVVVLLIGFREIGSPAVQRATAADDQRIRDFRAISNEMFRRKHTPQTLSDLGGTWKDPERAAPYEYFRDSDTQYRLCAGFNGTKQDSVNVFWSHGPGHQCYSLTVDVYR